MPLLMAGSAWAGEYDGKWRGSGTLECKLQTINFDLRFIVDDGAVSSCADLRHYFVRAEQNQGEIIQVSRWLLPK